MHVEKISIDNIKATDHYEMVFRKPAGWHVLIGDNGTGKSSIIRAIALALIGPTDSQSLRLPLGLWIKQGKEASKIVLTIKKHEQIDGHAGRAKPRTRPFDATIRIVKNEDSGIGVIEKNGNDTIASSHIWSGKQGWFCSSFGPFRRFSGGDKDWSKIYYSNPRAAAHLSAFGEDVALTESLDWLSHLKFRSLEGDVNAQNVLKGLIALLNDGDLLPQGIELSEINSGGVTFIDVSGNKIDVLQMSDGFRSVLSLIFELIRQLCHTYGEQWVFQHINQNDYKITLPGVVLIDEVDAHLHPTWQTRIGEWFTRYFPEIQFIVTTHSPLICRGCVDKDGNEQGTIWRLAVPGTDQKEGEITGDQKKRLIFGNVLDAYSTDAFGINVSQSETGLQLSEQIAALSLKSFKGTITDADKSKLKELKSILPTAQL